ncbi:hypothetical protein ACFL6I_18950 [candidate division KSB1 bacterium]
MYRNFIPLFLFIALVLLINCKHDPEEILVINDTTGTPIIVDPCDPDTSYFKNEVLPILLSSCAKSGCHDAITAEHNVILTDYTNIIQTGEVTPFDPSDSKLYEVITDSDPNDRMPSQPDAPLTSSQISIIYKWIIQGALNNSCDGGPCDSINVTYSGTVWPIVQNYCFGCHSGTTPQGNVSLDSYFTVAGAANDGSLYGAISHSPPYSFMPKNGQKLNNCNIAQIKKWIDEGAQNN